MREEFKFVKGLYTNKKLFDDDIVNNSFVILDKNCQEVSFDAEDNSKTQSQLISVSDDDRVCKLYTITPDKITMEGNLVKGDESDYKFTPKINKSIDDNEMIPSDVINTASEKLALTAKYNLNVGNIGIGKDSNPGSVKVTFTYDGKSFTRDMTFKATGYVDKRLLVPIIDATGASLENEEVYYLEDDKYKRLSNIKDTDVFHNGRKQEKVQVAETIFPANEIQLRIEDSIKAIADSPAHHYKAPDNYKFNHNNSDKLTYTEILESGSSSFTLGSISSGQGALLNLTFTPPSDNNCLYLPNAKNKYIIESNKFIEITDENNYPFGTEQAIYDNTNYYPYEGFAYQDSSTDANEYKKLDNPTTIPINSDNVRMTNTYTAAPLFNLDEGHPYTIAIKEDSFKITATEE